MKMTIDIDEAALEHFMSVVGIKKKKEAVNEAIRLADRIARKRKLTDTSISKQQLANAIDNEYSLTDLREKDVPR
ncbi:MAG: type II toxin-antitoxin system VapB family antitoxin [Spirochaetales bacterium]|nr:type II toxin-antitoxin system VapB family antitoxin [Spirochaetales bacterium]